MLRSTSLGTTVLALVLVSGGVAPRALAQAVKGRPRGDGPAPLSYRGVVPGVTTAEELREKLGPPIHEAEWYAWKLLYPAEGAPGHFDAIHMQASKAGEGTIGTIEAASVPAGYETLGALRARLGAPEYWLTLPSGQHIVDYSEKGLRFAVDARDRTIGVAYFPNGDARVHSGERRRVDLSRLPEGPREPLADSAPAPDLLAGAAEVDISPAPEHWPREFRMVTPLRARCAVFARGDLRVAIAGADLFGMLKSEIDPIAARLREQGIDHLLVSSSHDHAAPDSIGIYGFYPADWVAAIQSGIERGVLAAAARLRPVEQLLVGARDLPLTGARVEGLFRNARNPGIVDPQIAVVEARGEDDRPIVTIVQFACHVEGIASGESEFTADFPGYLCDTLRERRGAQAVFLNGAVGGMVSGDTRARTHEESLRMGTRLADEIGALLEIATPSRTNGFACRQKRLEIPVTNLKFIAFQRLHAGRRPEARGRLITEMFHLRLGDAEFLSVPGELLPEVSFELLEQMRGYPRMIVGLANDQLGYLIPGYDFRLGVYEESMSPGPAAAPLVKECGLRLIDEARP